MGIFQPVMFSQKGHSHDADWDDEGGPSVVRPTVVVIFGSCFFGLGYIWRGGIPIKALRCFKDPIILSFKI